MMTKRKKITKKSKWMIKNTLNKVIVWGNISLWGVVYKKGILYHLESLTALKNACDEMWISYQVIK